jgi:hypothetical protein
MINWIKNKFKRKYPKTLTAKQRDLLDQLDTYLFSLSNEVVAGNYPVLFRVQIPYESTLFGISNIVSKFKNTVTSLEGIYIPRSIAFVNNGDWEIVFSVRQGLEPLDPATNVLFTSMLNLTDDARTAIE